MKRLWLGIGILAVLLVVGITATVSMENICQPLTEALNEAAEAVQTGQWEQALELSETAHARWQHWRGISAAITNHEPMEEVDALFDTLKIYARQRDVVRFADCCAQLAALTDAISESQAIYWWNVL